LTACSGHEMTVQCTNIVTQLECHIMCKTGIEMDLSRSCVWQQHECLTKPLANIHRSSHTVTVAVLRLLRSLACDDVSVAENVPVRPCTCVVEVR